MTVNVKIAEAVETAVLDDAHIGHIHGAFGTILHGDVAPRKTWKHRLTTLLAILGPGLIVMAGDNDAGAFATYGQAGQNYGTTLLVDAGAADPGPLRQPGDGAAPRRGHRRRPCAPHLRALRQVLGRVQRHRSVPAQRADDRHRVHRHLRWRSTISGSTRSTGRHRLRRARHRSRSAPATSGASSGSRWPSSSAACCSCRSTFMVHPPLAQVAHDFVVPQIPATASSAT